MTEPPVGSIKKDSVDNHSNSFHLRNRKPGNYVGLYSKKKS